MSNSARLSNLPVFEPRESLRERVTRELRAALMTGRLEPGVVYSAPVLADQFGVSATPVREAMLDLVKEGLVQPVRNKGFRVTKLDEKALDDCIELRQLIEPAMVERISRTCPAEVILGWMPVAEEIVAAAHTGDITGYIDADMRFHLGLLGESGNQLLVDTVRDLRYRSRLMGIPKLARAGMLVPSAAEHVELLQLMAAPDPAAARGLMSRHLDHVRGLWAGVEQEVAAS